MLETLYNDTLLTAVLKPPGVDSESGMVGLLQQQPGGSYYPVHRLDQAVGGVMVFAKTSKCAAELTKQIRSGTFRKTYLAVVPDMPQPKAGELADLLYFDRSRRKSFVVKRQRAGVKEARLAYETLEIGKEGALVSVQLFTGRTHQIRVQFASRKLPLLGDGKYGSRDNRCGIALWSHSIALRHPETGQELTFSAAPPLSYPWSGFSCLTK